MCCFLVLCHALLFMASCGLLRILPPVHILEAHLSLLFKPLCHLVCVAESQEQLSREVFFLLVFLETCIFGICIYI